MTCRALFIRPEYLADLIATATPGRIAGFFAETIQGVGGAVALADGYLPAVRPGRFHPARRIESDVKEGETLPCVQEALGFHPGTRAHHVTQRILNPSLLS